jgi:hypothetical protein
MATKLSSPPACRSVIRAPPTHCVWRWYGSFLCLVVVVHHKHTSSRDEVHRPSRCNARPKRCVGLMHSGGRGEAWRGSGPHGGASKRRVASSIYALRASLGVAVEVNAVMTQPARSSFNIHSAVCSARSGRVLFPSALQPDPQCCPGALPKSALGQSRASDAGRGSCFDLFQIRHATCGLARFRRFGPRGTRRSLRRVGSAMPR